MKYKQGKWADQIIKLQHDDGSWGFFHTLSKPSPGQPMTTEQALRRLYVLGFSIDDKPIKKTITYLHNCLNGKLTIPDRREKLHDWDIFTDLMLSTWIKKFIPEDKLAKKIQGKWTTIINSAFDSGEYDNNKYISTYENIFGIKPKGGRLVDFVSFYQISLLTNCLDKNIEPKYFKYILEHDPGIYYIYGKKIIMVPKVFQSKYTSYYMGAIEMLAEYNNPECKKQLNFIVKWLNHNKNKENKWDMGKEAKDGIYFPLSDSWRKEEDRIKDCTYRIEKIIDNIVK